MAGKTDEISLSNLLCLLLERSFESPLNKPSMWKNTLYLLCCFFLCSTALSAQSPEAQARKYLMEHLGERSLQKSDVEQLQVQDVHFSKPSGLTYVYFVQTVHGIEVAGGLCHVVLDANGKVFRVSNQLVPAAQQKALVTQPGLQAGEAVVKAAEHLRLPDEEAGLPKGYPQIIAKKSKYEFEYAHAAWSKHPITARLVYLPVKAAGEEGQSLQLCWKVEMLPPGSSDHWVFFVDALSGDILAQHNRTVYCANPANVLAPVSTCVEEEESVALLPPSPSTDGAVYNVFALPVESPAHGDRSLLVDPADADASPYGWHDTDGQDGAEFTYTRGNNVHAFWDGNADGSADFNTDGGADLQFDFPYDPAQEPAEYKDASITNLFAAINTYHDIMWHYGFDEEGGAFQQTNYSGASGAGDGVIARGSYGSDDPEANSALNNANFSTPPDGGSGVMNMFLWSSGNRLVEVTEPASIAGLYSTGVAQYGPDPLTVNVTGQVVAVEDPTYAPFITDGCETPFVNADELDGKIALIDRGGCYFELKTANAEEAGAIAVIICNFEEGTIGMAGVPDIPDPNIPTVMLDAPDCAILRQALDDGLFVTIGQPTNSGPVYLTSDLDNGIIIHENTHGLSNRLTGGRFNTDCLFNGEQMGEGWSDFYAIALTVQPGDTPEKRRGVGTYVIRQNTDGKGIRAYPYSTDMEINPLTYSDIVAASVPHGVGTVWCSMLWDLYWAMSDEYGWDPDIYNGTGGNNMAIQLVTEAMKMQNCSPGFVDGRDAILAADYALYGGANQCLIWEVFARRGLGYYADQGSANDNKDGVEDFTVLPTCIAELKIEKSATELIEAGDEIDYTLHIINHRDADLTGVTVTDVLADGLTYVAGSGSIEPVVNGNTLVFEIGDMAYLDEVTITYKALSSPDLYSLQQFYDDFEGSTIGVWAGTTIGPEATNLWGITNADAYSGSKSFFVEDISSESQQVLQMLQEQTISGAQPVLRFYHRYQTEAGVDGGYLQVSTDFGATWQAIPADKMFKNPYNGPIDYSTFVIPFLDAFWGNSGGWIPTYVDMSEYQDQDVFLRFAFGTNEAEGGLGWFVDDVEFMDMFNYNSEACVTSDQGDMACAMAPGKGTIVESQLSTPTKEVSEEAAQVRIFPNPATDHLNIQVDMAEAGNLHYRILTTDGKLMLEGDKLLPAGRSAWSLPFGKWERGLYLLELQTDAWSVSRKLVLK